MADFTEDDDALLDELGIEVEAKKTGGRTPREERVIAGFEEIQRFVAENGRVPRHGEGPDIFERLYAVRLDRLRVLPDCRAILEPLDHQRLLAGHVVEGEVLDDDLDDDALLAELLADDEGHSDDAGITELLHVRSSAERRAAEDIANRQRCEDFATFKPLFEKVQKELASGVRATRAFELKAEIEQGSFFIVGGQKAYVAEKGEVFSNDQGRTDARLRVIFDNGTESNMLMRSLQRSLNKDDAGRRITDPSAGPLFADHVAEGDEASGTIYVLRSKSDHPLVAANRDLVHKIGVTNLSVRQRIAGARLQPTFLMADVEIVATYELYNINRVKLENLIHRVFGPARLDIEIRDRFGIPIVPREWFLVPLFAIEEVVEKIKEGSISRYIYSSEKAALEEVSDASE